MDAPHGCLTLLAIVLVLLAPIAWAAPPPVWRCLHAEQIAYQDHPCADPATQRELRLPNAAPAHAVATAAPAATRYAPSAPGRASRRSQRQTAVPIVLSHECRSRDGALFYRHDRCPGSIPGSGMQGNPGRGCGAASVPVSGRTLPRREACKRMRASSAGRPGNEHDERVSSYERNLGRDPCRRY